MYTYRYSYRTIYIVYESTSWRTWIGRCAKWKWGARNLLGMSSSQLPSICAQTRAHLYNICYVWFFFYFPAFRRKIKYALIESIEFVVCCLRTRASRVRTELFLTIRCSWQELRYVYKNKKKNTIYICIVYVCRYYNERQIYQIVTRDSALRLRVAW